MTPWRRVIPSVAVAAGVLLATAAAASRGVAGWETTRSADIAGWDGVTGSLEVLMQSGTRGAVVLAVALAAAFRARLTAWSIGVAGAGAWVSAELTKEVVGRPRPTAGEFEGFGYPSTHTAIATAIAVAVMWRYPRRGWPIVVLPIATAVARIHVGAHWPIDVVGGAAIGVIAAGLATAVVDRTDPRPSGIPVVAAVGSASARRSASTIRVATFNIRNGRAFNDGRHLWWLRRGMAAQAMLDVDADVIGIQEAFRFQVRTLARVLPEHRWAGVGRNAGGRGEYCAVFWRAERFDLESTSTRWFGDRPDTPGSTLPDAPFPRVVTTVDLVDASGGARLLVANTHLDAASVERRIRSAGQLVEWVDHLRPAVIVGDLNSVPNSPPLDVLVDGGWTRAQPRRSTSGVAPATNHDFEPGSKGTVIDHILVSPEVEVLDAAVWQSVDARRLPSDHWPVSADVEVSAPGSDDGVGRGEGGDQVQ